MSKLEFFTEIRTILSEVGEKRLESINNSSEESDNPYNYEWFIENNIEPPSYLKPNQSEIDEDGMVTLGDDDLTYTYNYMLINTSNFSHASEEEMGTLLMFLDGREYLVEESLEEVYIKINYKKWRQWLLVKWVGLLNYLKNLRK